MNQLFDVKKEFPKRGKEVIVIVERKEHEATLFHNDWVFSPESRDKLEIKNMRDSWEPSNKITHWRYK